MVLCPLDYNWIDRSIEFTQVTSIHCSPQQQSRDRVTYYTTFGGRAAAPSSALACVPTRLWRHALLRHCHVSMDHHSTPIVLNRARFCLAPPSKAAATIDLPSPKLEQPVAPPPTSSSHEVTGPSAAPALGGRAVRWHRALDVKGP